MHEKNVMKLYEQLMLMNVAEHDEEHFDNYSSYGMNVSKNVNFGATTRTV